MSEFNEPWNHKTVMIPKEGFYHETIVNDDIDQVVDFGVLAIPGKDTSKDFSRLVRICTCVNALAGIPNSALEAGVIKEMVEALENSSQALRRYHPESPTAESIDNLLAKLEAK